jgi:hypothetical protein
LRSTTPRWARTPRGSATEPSSSHALTPAGRAGQKTAPPPVTPRTVPET